MGTEIILDSIRNYNILPVVFGATASGKTALTIALSEYLPIEIVSADSRQIYEYMSIGTAKPTPGEIAAVPHHLVDFLSPAESYSAGRFAADAELAISGIVESERIPVVAGGSGLYIKALCEGFFAENKFDYSAVRAELSAELETRGIDALYDELLESDRKSWALYADKNPRRVLRALEYFRAHGRPISADHEEKHQQSHFKPIYFYLDWQRDELYNRINKRTEIMWESGLAYEARQLLEMGFAPDLNSLNTVGYKETFAFLDGKMDARQAIEEIKKNTRHYAKRQLTWFRRYIEAIPLAGHDPRSAAESMKSALAKECLKISDQ